jgi:parvulin-like peptidyl-prolyl isomerase
MALRSTAVCLVLLLSAAGALAAGGALSVNGVEVGAAEVALVRGWARLESPVEAADEARATTIAVDKIVADILLAAEATRAGEKLSKKEVREGIAAFRSRVGGDASYKELLRAAGASEEDLARLVERHLLARRFVEKSVAPTVSVSDAEARAWYAEPGNQIYHSPQVKVRLIFVNASIGDAKAEAKAKERLEAARARILAGEDFAAVATEVSEDMSRENGGDLGWLSRGAAPRAVEAAVAKLEPGETSEVLPGRFGFGLIQVVDRRPAGPTAFDEARDGVVSGLVKEKTNRAVAAAVAGLREKAAITVNDPL